MVEDILIPSCPPVLWSLVSDCQEAYDNREDPEGRREVLILDMLVAQIIGRLLHRKLITVHHSIVPVCCCFLSPGGTMKSSLGSGIR